MTGATSYYDWTLNFKKKNKSTFKLKVKDRNVNSLGILETDFKSYLKQWKMKNHLNHD